jgi:asparagine synthase (glutamine-hydrolysing)
MTGALVHRGPDGEGFHVDGPVGLGHRRLAIIDLSGGAQPMAVGDGALWITYNGELYNFQELRRELCSLGCVFRTSSDTEVVVQAYRAWGPDCVRHFRGMFAFAIWDAPGRRLFAARDRLGIKPLVYAWDGSRLCFASEIKALLEDPELPRRLDPEALAQYFTYLYVPSPRTIFSDIKKLPPASYLLCRLDGGAPEIHRYWDLDMTPRATGSERDWTERVEASVLESVKLHMVSDVPIGAFLSGGVDSSTVVACMAKVAGRPVKTFSIGFDESDFDELRYARQVAARYGTDHFELVLKPDVMEVLPRLAWQFDEPFGDASAVPTYCVSRITREHVTVALSGDGGDEGFAGYRRYAEAVGVHERMDRPPLSLLKPALRWIGAMRREGARAKAFLEHRGLAPVDRYHHMMTYAGDTSLQALLDPAALEGRVARPASESFRALAARAGTEDYVSVLQYIDIHSYLPDDILTKVDRTSMLTSLESRVPLLDHVLMEQVAALPSSVKLRRGIGKHILKEAMRPHLPPEILNRRKMGFGVPLASWLRKDLRDYAQDVLLGARARQRGIVRPLAVRGLLERHLRGDRDYSSQLWSLICFELWCRNWWDR